MQGHAGGLQGLRVSSAAGGRSALAFEKERFSHTNTGEGACGELLLEELWNVGECPEFE